RGTCSRRRRSFAQAVKAAVSKSVRKPGQHVGTVPAGPGRPPGGRLAVRRCGLGLFVYIWRVATTGLCSELMAWSTQYPAPSASAEQNYAARMDEDAFLARFDGLAELDRDQVTELVGWKFQGMAHRKALALRGITPERWEDHDSL